MHAIEIVARWRSFDVLIRIVNHSDDIPGDVRALIARHIDSVVQLELLLLFHRDRTRPWSADDAARELRVERQWTAQQLDTLARRGLLTSVTAAAGEVSYRFAADTPDLADTVDRLAALYAARRVSIIGLIYSQQTDTLRSFADAFRIRKEGN